MKGIVIAHFIIPATYNDEKAILACIEDKWIGIFDGYRTNVFETVGWHLNRNPMLKITWETVGMNGDRDLVKGDGHNHVYLVDTKKESK